MPVRIPEQTPYVKEPAFDVELTLAKCSLADKIALLSGKGVPSIRLSDGPNGCRGTKFFEGVSAACFPCATGLASSWDVELVQRVGEALAVECRAKNVHVLLAPTVNMHRTPINGRGFESFSEDPHLSGKLAGAYIRGCQSRGVGCAIKHLVCNDQETDRYSVSAEVSERALREIYLKPFELAIKESNPWVVMTSYNRVNGVHASETKRLIDGLLRDEWRWKGMLVSDWHATYSIVEAIKAGLDLEMPGPAIIRGNALRRMVTCGKVSVAYIDTRARNVLELVGKVKKHGVIGDGTENINPDGPVDLLRQAAADAVVLLRNDDNILPLPSNARQVAVIGPNAERAELFGGGSAGLASTYSISPLEGTRAAVGPETIVRFAKGCDSHKLTPLMGEQCTNAAGAKGVDITFYNDKPTVPGREPIHHVATTHCNMFFNDNLPDTLDLACYATLTATFTPDRSGTYEFGVGALGTADLYINDGLLIDNSTAPVPGDVFFGKGSREETAEINLEAGVTYDIRIEYASPSASTSFAGPLALKSRGGLRFGGYLKLSAEQHLQEAVKLAQESEVVIVVVGLNAEYETEGYDRPHMRLPDRSVALVNAILAVRPDAVTCNQSGTPVELNFDTEPRTLVHFFYNGNEVGAGLADVLFGKVSPSAKLPYTWPKALRDVAAHRDESTFPGVHQTVRYDEGCFVGYRRRHRDTQPKVLFPFGHGLSYTTFGYGPLSLNVDLATALSVSLSVRNTGQRAGREVVQFYIATPKGKTERPMLELGAFVKTALLQPGEEEVVVASISKDAFALWDEARDGWVVPAGAYGIVAASSSEKHHSSVDAIGPMHVCQI